MKKTIFNILAALFLIIGMGLVETTFIGTLFCFMVFAYFLQKAGVVNWMEEIYKED